MYNPTLPEFCYALNNSTNRIVLVKRDEQGYYPCKETGTGQELVDILNEGLGVTKDKAEAMKVGSVFGFGVPGANPDMYDKNGNPKPLKLEELKLNDYVGTELEKIIDRNKND